MLYFLEDTHTHTLIAGVCLARVPLNGRTFEYLSGEDPYLGYTLVQGVIKGIQATGKPATAACGSY